MKKLLLTIALLLGISLPVQGRGNTVTLLFPGVPSGSCAFIMVGINSATGDVYHCNSGSWLLIGPFGGIAATGDSAASFFSSGTLEVGIGGTGAGAFTLGSVVFAGAAGVYTQDNANFFWNDSSNRLGVGTAFPSQTVELRSSSPIMRIRDIENVATATTAFIEFGGTTAASFDRTGFVGDAQSGNTDILLQAEDSDLHLGDSSSPSVIVLRGGNVGIGTATPSVKFDARGSTLLSPAEGDLSNTPRWILKVVDFSDMMAGQPADTFTLWTLPANTMIHDVVATVVTGWSGGSISAAVCSVGEQAGPADGLALDDNFFATGTRYELHDATASGGKGIRLFDATDKFAPYMFLAGGVIEIQCDLTGDDHIFATAGQARIQIFVSQPLANTTIEAN
ncbi:hypothetical protein LCGC14_1213910 [marine sediment metagenome]|uniref:Uncharacterized protein n=1 Tax=marine sediment metagenome TaxID=412755 RepID=A0A0F9PHX1_9ZZZZ